MAVEERALATTAPQSSSVALPADMEARIQASVQRRVMLERILESVLVPGVDIMRVPGSDKPGLSKPGAESMGFCFNLRPEFHVESKTEPDPGAHVDGTPYIAYVVRFILYDRSTGDLVGEGLGSCNTWETKYRYRWEEEITPDGERKRVRVENTQAWDQHNTIVKMAKKRAHVDAILTATGASRMLTQDVEEMLDQVEPASKKQLNFLRQMAERKHLDGPALAALIREVIGEDVAVSKLTRNQAHDVIDRLTGKSGKSEDAPKGTKGTTARARGNGNAAAPQPAQDPAPATPASSPVPLVDLPDPNRMVHLGNGDHRITAAEAIAYAAKVAVTVNGTKYTVAQIVAEKGVGALHRVRDAVKEERVRWTCDAVLQAMMSDDEWQAQEAVDGEPAGDGDWEDGPSLGGQKA